MSIVDKIKSLEKRGTAIIGIEYEGSTHPLKNLRIGDAKLTEPPYGEAETSAVFCHAGTEYIRAVDHNAGEKIKVFEIAKIKSLTVDGQTITA